MSHSNAASEEVKIISKKVTNVEELLIKCQCWVKNKEGEERMAEILSINTRRSPPKFYVHYINYNKRLDEWITTCLLYTSPSPRDTR